jgi:hypothetical protein
LTFEPGSQLSDLGEFAFADCSSLWSICLPAGLHTITPSALWRSTIDCIAVDPDNPVFAARDGFLVDLSRDCLVWYFGRGPEVNIWSDIRAISGGCFNRCDCAVSVTFASGSRLSVLDASAFEKFSSLQSISIPASVEAISKFCFRYCTNLSNLTFEPGSHISNLGESTFEKCSSLRLICLPSSIEAVAKSCFFPCDELSELTF